jgi:putative ABC transport system ATP-binding protein
MQRHMLCEPDQHDAPARDGVLACDNASLCYTDGERTTYALRDVSVTLPPGRFYGIMGPSGSGKSSLLYVLSALKQPTNGSARFGAFVYNERAEAEITRLRRERFGFVFQQPFLMPYLSALENVVLAAPRIDKAATEKARGFLRELGMAGLEHKLPSQLSGGEKQRVSVARAMMNDPEVIFADEPTAALDHANGHRVIDALARWRTRGTVVVVTHDPEMLADADEILLLRDGVLVSGDRPARDERADGSSSAASAVAAVPFP